MIDKTRLDGILFAIMGDDTLVEQWWQRPNVVFAMRTPLDTFEQEPEKVRDWVLRAANLDDGDSD